MQLTQSLPKDAAYRPPRLRVLDESQRRDARSQRRRRERDARRERAAMATHACDGDTVTLLGGGAAAGLDAADVRRGDSTGGGGGGAHLLSEEPLSCDRHRVLLHRFDDSAGMLTKLIEHTASGRAHEVGRLKTLAGDEEGGGSGGGAGGGGEAAAPVYESSRMRNIDAAAMTSGADELARIRDTYVHTDLPVRLQQVADMFKEIQQNDALVVADGEEDTHELELLTFAKLFPTASPMRSRIDQLFNFDEMDYRDVPLPIHAVSNAKEALNGLMESVRRFVRIQRLQMQQHADRNLEAELRRSKEQLAKTIESLVEANSKVRLLEKQKAAQLTQVVAKARTPVAAPLARSSSSASLAADEAAAREHEQRERLLTIQAQEAAAEQRRHRPSLLSRRSHDASSDASVDADERQHREAVAVPLPGKPLPTVPQTPDTDSLVPASPAFMDSSASGSHFAAGPAAAVTVGAPPSPTVLPSLQLPCPVTVTATVATGTSDLDPDSPLKAVALTPAAAATPPPPPPPVTVSTATQSMSVPKPVLVAKETQAALAPPPAAAAAAATPAQQLSPAMSPQQAGKGPPSAADQSSEAGASRRSGRGKRQKEQAASVLLVESSQTLASPRETDDDDDDRLPLAAPRPESVPQMLRYLLGADPEPLPGAAPPPPGAGSALDSEEQLQRNALAPMDYVGLRDRWETMRNERLELQSKQQQQQQSSKKPKKKKLDAAARQRRKKHAERAERDVLLMVLRQANLEIYRRDLLAGVVSSTPAAASMLAASTGGDSTRRASAAQRRTSAQQGGGGPSADDIWGLLGIPAVGDGGRVLVAETLAAGTLRDEGFASDVRACAEEQAEREADEAEEGAEGTRARGGGGAAGAAMMADLFPKARSQPVYLRRRDAPVVAMVPESKRLAVKRLCCSVGPGEDVSVAEFAEPSLYQYADSHGEGARRLATYLDASWTCETEKAESDFALFVGFTIGNVHERALSQPAKVVGMLQCVLDGVAQTFLKVVEAQEDGDAVCRFEVVARKDDYVVVGAAKKDLTLALLTSLRCLHYCHRRFHTPTRLNLCVGATLASTRLLADQVRAGEILVDTAVDFVPGECLKHFFLQHFDVPIPGSGGGGDVGKANSSTGDGNGEDGTEDEGEEDKPDDGAEDGVSRGGGSTAEAASVVSAYSLIDKRVGNKRDALEAQAARHPLSKAADGSLSTLVRIHERQTADLSLVLRNADRQEAVPPPPEAPSTAVVVVDILGSAAAWRNVLLHYTKAEAAGTSGGSAAATTTAASVAAAVQAAADTAADAAAAASFASSGDDEPAAPGASVVCSGGVGEAAAAPAGEAGAADAKPRHHRGPHAAFVECVMAFRRDVRQGLRAAHGWEVWCGCESFVCCFKTQKDALRFCTNVVGAYEWPLALFTDTPQLTGVVRVGAACSRAERVVPRADGVIAGAAVAAAALLCGACGGGEVLISQKMDGVAKKLSYETERTELHCVEGCPDFLASSLVQGCADRGVLEANKQRKLDYHVGPKVSSELLRIHQRVRVFSMMLSRLSKAGEEMPFTDEQFNQLWTKIINNKASPESFDVDEFVELNPKVKPLDLMRIKSSMESASRFVIDSTSREARAVADSQIPMLSKSILGYLTRSIKAFYKIRKGDAHYLAKDAPGLNFEKVMAAMLSKTHASPEAVGALEKESSTGKRLATLVARNRGRLTIGGKGDRSPAATAVATPASVPDVGLSPPPQSAGEALPTLWRRPGTEAAAPRQHSASVAVAPPSEAAGTATPSLPDLDDKGSGSVAAAPPVGSALLRKLAQAKRPAAAKGDAEPSTPLSQPSRFPLADVSAPRLGGFGGSEPQGSPKMVDIGSLAAASMAAQRMVEKKEPAKRPLATSSNVHSPVPMQLNLNTPMFPGFSSIASVKKRVREPLRKARQAVGRPAHSG